MLSTSEAVKLVPADRGKAVDEIGALWTHGTGIHRRVNFVGGGPALTVLEHAPPDTSSPIEELEHLFFGCALRNTCVGAMEGGGKPRMGKNKFEFGLRRAKKLGGWRNNH